MRPIDEYFLNKPEPIKSSLHFLREYLLEYDENITESWRYGMPFYYYNGKMFCYLWVHKKYHRPYLGIVEGRRIEHPELIIEKRAKMKILLFDAKLDIPVDTIDSILKIAIALYK